MEDLQFLRVDDLAEQDLMELRRILNTKGAGRKPSIEFLLTAEARAIVDRRRRDNEMAAIRHISSSNQNSPVPQLPMNYPLVGVPVGSTRFQAPLVNFSVPPPSLNYHFVQDGSARNGVPMQQIPATFVPGQQRLATQLFYPIWNQGQVHLVPVNQPFPAAQYHVPTTAVPGYSPPFYTGVAAPPGQPAMVMTSPPPPLDNVNLHSPGQNCAANQAAVLPELSNTVQEPAVDHHRSTAPPNVGETRANGAEAAENAALLEAAINASPNFSAEPVSASVVADIPSDAVDLSQEQKETSRQLESPIEQAVDDGPKEPEGYTLDDVEASSKIAQVTTEDTQPATMRVKTDDQRPVKEEPKTWASLFKNTRAANEAIVTTVLDEQFYDALDDDDVALQIAIHESTQGNATLDEAAKKKQQLESQFTLEEIWVSADRDPTARQLADALKKSVLVDRGPTYATRGITNQGNWCYANATLQALMACPTFYHFLRNLFGQIRRRVPSSTPLLDACTKLASEFTLVKDMNKSVKNAKSPPPLDISFMHSIICQLKTDSSFKGRQEDAEEFLLFVLNRLHEELVAVLSLSDKEKTGKGQRPRNMSGTESETTGSASSEWQHVGAGKKITVTRQIKVAQSPILDIFAGQLRYGLLRPGAKESANLEPFFTLPLDVLLANVKDIKSALQAFTSKEIVKNCEGNNKTEVDATRRVTFFELPRVLIFQLKYFEYTTEGVKKNIKQIDYGMDLLIGQEFLSNQKIALRECKYKLFAVVFHHGEAAEGGHYTVDVFHAGQWLNIDDTIVTQVNNEHVLSYKPPRVPYLLLYRRFEQQNSDQQQQRRSDGGSNHRR